MKGANNKQQKAKSCKIQISPLSFFINSKPLFRTIKLNLLFLVSPSPPDIHIADAAEVPRNKNQPNLNRQQQQRFRFEADINKQNVGLEIFICGVIASGADC